MTTQLRREQILGAAAGVPVWEPSGAEPEEVPASRAWPAVSPWLLAVGALGGLVLALVLWYVLPVELNRAGVWEPNERILLAPVASVAPPAPTVDYVISTMRIWCDGVARDLVSASEVTPALTRACWADYGWSTERQLAWMQLHP